MSFLQSLKRRLARYLRGKLDKGVILLMKSADTEKVGVLQKRCQFFLEKDCELIVTPCLSKILIFLLFNRGVKLIGDDLVIPSLIRKFFYNVDYINNHHDAWVWHSILLNSDGADLDCESLKKRFFEHFDSFDFDKCYLFGTGPSMNLTGNFDFKDGFRVVCNTIVKDQKQWEYLNPHAIVAGDALYHFSDSRFATRFREDLKTRLLNTPKVIFVFPKLYYPFLLRELNECKDQLFPVEVNNSQKIKNLRDCFKLPNLGNVLNLLLLPVSISISKNIFLLGFDGKSPQDQFFWKNSSDMFYPEEFESLVKEHPKFFEYYVPKAEPEKYVKAVHGDALDKELTSFEEDGYKFELLAPSFTPTLSKRYHGR